MTPNKFTLIFFLVLTANTTFSFAQTEVLFKQVDTTKLFLEVYKPDSMESSKKYPAMIFFFGGGWKGGSKAQFEHHANYFSKRGIVCFLADYRIESKHGTTPYECLKDAKSAIRFVRSNAAEFKIDPNKIIASGGSAGGHLAAATSLIDGFNDSIDDLTVSCKPNALVLYNPVIDISPGGYGYDRVKDLYKEFSPLHNVVQNTPPTIFFLGTKDELIPVETAHYFKRIMEKVGSRCELRLYKNQKHGFFNYHHFKHYKKTVKETDKFLQSLGYLKADPIVKIE